MPKQLTKREHETLKLKEVGIHCWTHLTQPPVPPIHPFTFSNQKIIFGESIKIRVLSTSGGGCNDDFDDPSRMLKYTSSPLALKLMSLLLNYSMRYYGKSSRITTSTKFYNNVRHLWLSHATLSHYQTLGISRAASQADIKRAFYDLSKKHHPDKDEGCGEKFREISTAYEVLGNPRLRRLYDRGLLEEPDASIHYPSADSSSSDVSSAGISDEDKEKSRARVAEFDQWSQSHISETFYRSQYDKQTQQKRERAKMQARSSTGENKVLFLVLVLGIGIYFLLPDSENNDKKRKS